MSDEALPASLLDALPGIVYATDPEGRLTFANPRFCALVGRERPAIVGHELSEVLPLYLVAQTLEHERHVVELSMPVARQIEGRGTSGSGRAWLVLKFPLQAPSAGVGTVVTDVTDQVRDSELTRREASFIREVFDRIPNLVYAKDRDHRFTLANRAMAQLLDCAPQQALGRTEAELGVAAEEASRSDRDDEGALHGGGEVLTPEEPRQGPLGERWFRTTRQPLQPEGSEAEQLLVVGTDITEYRNAQRERLRLKDERMDAIGRLTGGIAHDLNNLLTVLQTGTDILRDMVGPDAEGAFIIDDIAQVSARAATLTRHLLAYGRRQVLRPERLMIDEVVRAELDALEQPLNSNIELRVELHASDCAVLVDRAGLQQVLHNLASNARDAMPDGGILRIETRHIRAHTSGDEPGDVVELTVQDTGVGIPEALLERVLEPFFTTKPQGKGTGLGLSTVYGIVRQSGGGMVLHGNEGTGARVVVTLPVAEPES